MVTRTGAYHLMVLVGDLTYVYERCRSYDPVWGKAIQECQVKGERFILDALRRNEGIINGVANSFGAFDWVKHDISGWAEYLERKYCDPDEATGQPINLDLFDASRLKQAANEWQNALFEIFMNPGTALMSVETLQTLFPPELLSTMDRRTQNDLKAAVRCAVHLIPTPAAMISLRAAESIVRGYYSKVTSSPSAGKSWGTILNDLVQNQQQYQLKRSLLGYLDHLRAKRNEAEHPDKEFTQEESETILLHIKDLLNETK